MDTANQGPSGSPEQDAGGAAQETQETVQSVQPTASSGSDAQTVKYESYRKAVNEKKKLQAQAEEMSARLAELEETQMATEGKKDELIQSLQGRLKEKEAKLKETYSTFAYNSVAAQLKAEAHKLGCVDAETLIQVTPLDSLEVGEDFNVDGESLKMLLEEQKEKRPYLFQRQSVAVKDGVPAKPNTETTKDLSKMSIQEKSQLLAQMQIDKNKR